MRSLLFVAFGVVCVTLITLACWRTQNGDELDASRGSPATGMYLQATGTTTMTTPTASPVSTPAPMDTVDFPTQEMVTGGEALLIGALIDEGGCLLVVSEELDGDFLIIWPRGYSQSVEEGTIQIHDEAGRVVARVGDTIAMGGNAAGQGDQGDVCTATRSVWYASEPIAPAAEFFTATPVPSVPDVGFAQTIAPSVGDSELIGTLVLSAGCLRVVAEQGGGSYLVAWPPGIALISEHGSIVLDDGGKHRVGWIGADLHLTGEPVMALPEGIPFKQPPPATCVGPYWLAGSDVQLAEFRPFADKPARLNPDDSSVASAIEYAATYKLSLAEAIRRLGLQYLAGAIVSELRSNEADTFAGFWVEHEPEFKFVARFTGGGDETSRPYVTGTPLEGLVEVRNDARWTEAELEAQQAETISQLRELAIYLASEIDVREQRIRIWIADREVLESAVGGNIIQLPETVEIVDAGKEAPGS